MNDSVVRSLHLGWREMAELKDREREESERRSRRYRGANPARGLRGRTVIVVDDDVASERVAEVR